MYDFNIDVSYGSGGSIGILSGGLPNAVTLTISFQELSIQTAEDYELSIAPELGMTDYNPGIDPSSIG